MNYVGETVLTDEQQEQLRNLLNATPEQLKKIERLKIDIYTPKRRERNEKERKN